LSFSGVVSRKEFLIGLLPVFILSFLLAQIGLPLWASIPLGLPLVYVVLSLVVKRLRDRGQPWGLAGLVFVPVFGWIALAVLTSKGSGGKHRAGFSVMTGIATFITLAVLGSAVVPIAGEPFADPDGLVSEQNQSEALPEASETQEGEPAGDAAAEPESGLDQGETTGDGVEEDPSVAQPAPDEVPVETTGTLDALVGQLRVEPEMQDGYDRDLFRHWIDADGDGCDTRREVLIAESLTPVLVGSGCSLSGGQWYSAFDGVTTTDASSFDIDHFVPLKEAWDSGAHAWDETTRRQFANDLSYAGSLIAVTARSNRTKSASDPAGWLPPNRDYWCVYLVTWVEVKIRWNLSADAREVEAIRSAGASC
jgi:uncharacterized membrane protein YhaH (DUF805 family)